MPAIHPTVFQRLSACLKLFLNRYYHISSGSGILYTHASTQAYKHCLTTNLKFPVQEARFQAQIKYCSLVYEVIQSSKLCMKHYYPCTYIIQHSYMIDPLEHTAVQIMECQLCFWISLHAVEFNTINHHHHEYPYVPSGVLLHACMVQSIHTPVLINHNCNVPTLIPTPLQVSK